MLRPCLKGTVRRRAVLYLLGGFFIFLAGTLFLCSHKRETGAHHKAVPEGKECEKWQPSKFIVNASNPVIKLNPGKFLLPVLYNGPTNQLWGLRQAAFLAISLNRTLVLPVFRKHITDDSGPEDTVDPSYRFDVGLLAGLLSVVDMETFIQKCGGVVDGFFAAVPVRKWTLPTLEQTEKDLRVKLFNREKTGEVLLSNPVLSSIEYIPPVERGATRESISKHYASQSKCAIYAMPFRELNMQIARTSWKSNYTSAFRKFADSVQDVPDWTIVQAIHLNTPTAKYVQEISERFLRFTFGTEPYIALHWRYDEEDFQKFMCDKPDGEGNPNQAAMCGKVAKVTPNKLASAIRDHVEYVARKAKRKLSALYIASPRTTSALKFSKKLKKMLNNFKMEVYTQHDLEMYLLELKYFDRCHFLKKNLNEFLSLADMEIAARSLVFIRSTYSSWTDTVTSNRLLWHMDVAMRRFDRAAVNLVVPDRM